MKKLLNSKWTASEPKNNEKHFVVTKVKKNEEDPQIIDLITIKAVITKQEYRMKPKDLKAPKWIIGWK